MDRAVIVDANLRNANFERTVFTRSDLSRSDIYGADFRSAEVCIGNEGEKAVSTLGITPTRQRCDTSWDH
eukprot:1160070-Pelagomonas_calceolata.AAC.2